STTPASFMATRPFPPAPATSRAIIWMPTDSIAPWRCFHVNGETETSLRSLVLGLRSIYFCRDAEPGLRRSCRAVERAGCTEERSLASAQRPAQIVCGCGGCGRSRPGGYAGRMFRVVGTQRSREDNHHR